MKNRIQKIKDWYAENDLKIAVIILIVLFIALLITTNVYNRKVYETNLRILTNENAQLSNELVERDNEIYEISLDLKSTERTLADTSYELDNLAKELEELKENEQADKLLSLNYIGTYYCTAYCTEKYAHICGGGGNTASGAPVTANVSVAVTDLQTMPYGTVIYIEDVGIRIVQDTGGFSKDKIDVAVKTHKEASSWKGQGKHKVYIIQIGNKE